MPLATIHDLNLHYEVHGEGPVVVLAHGYCTSTLLWRHLIPPLAERYRVVAYDARGHGLSTAPEGKDHYTQARLVDELSGLLSYLDVDEAIVAGHSMGGATAIAFGARHPERTRALVICNIDGGHQPDDEATRIEKARMAEVRRRARQTVRQRGLVDYARQMIMTGTAPAFVLASEEERGAFVERYRRQPTNGYFGAGESRPWTETWLKEAARGLKMPLAIIAGTDDFLFKGAEALHQALPHSHFAIIEDAPHDSMNARPQAFNQAFLEYLESLEQDAPKTGRRRL